MQIDSNNSPPPTFYPPVKFGVGLLVSVRSATEALVACEGGADVIDIKEPQRGSLGAASPQVWRSICEVVPASIPITLALGEALELDRGILSKVPKRVNAVKLGPAGCEDLSSYLQVLSEVSHTLGIPCVQVVYADHQRANSPPLEAYLAEFAKSSPSECWLLIDTYKKDQRGLKHWISDRSREALIRQSQTMNFHVVLAGQLTSEDFETMRDFPPNLLAVRGAACVVDREGTLDRERVISLVEKIRDIWPNRIKLEPVVGPACRDD